MVCIITESKVLSTKGLIDDVPEEYLSHKEKYENAVRKAVLLYRAMKESEDPNQTEQEKAKYVLNRFGDGI